MNVFHAEEDARTHAPQSCAPFLPWNVEAKRRGCGDVRFVNVTSASNGCCCSSQSFISICLLAFIIEWLCFFFWRRFHGHYGHKISSAIVCCSGVDAVESSKLWWRSKLFYKNEESLIGVSAR